MEPDQAQAFRLLEVPELVLREIVSHLTGKALKSARLACKTLNLYATQPLFETIVLTPHEPHFDFLLNTFCTYSNGQLASHVRSLRFDCRYPADPSKPCFWNQSHMHRFHYDAYVLNRNVGTARAHSVYLLSEFGKVLDGKRFPRLQNIHISGDVLGSQGSDTSGTDNATPSFYLYRFQQLTGRAIDLKSQWMFDSTPERSKFHVICLLLGVWASQRRMGKITFANERLCQELRFAPAIEKPDNSKTSVKSAGNPMAEDFVSALRSAGCLFGADSNDCHDQTTWARRVETILADVLAR